MKIRLLVVAVVILAFVATLNAQTFRGSIQGTVTDSTGAAVSGATVTITSPATGLTRTVQSGATGDYVFPELPLGDYDLTVTQSGFRTATATGIHVTVATPVHLDVALQPGEVQQKVEVNAEVPMVEIASDTMGGTIEEKQISELPVNGRDFIKLMVLVPGSTADPSGVSDSPGAFGQFSINGNRGRSNNFLLDGTDMNDGYRNDP
ncbi:MAG TPA: carboxypeptidase-like regulatory domain-containing protein, partial [Terriglobales bacterium]|nr:carboxypeptidase-like regulatory domain-containing protein [Terriglobales bacterium]